MEDLIEKRKAEQKKQKRRGTLTALALISPFMIIFIVFTVIPFVMGFVFSFMQYNPYDPTHNAFKGFGNYLNIFDFDLAISKQFWQSFSTMLAFDLVAIPLLILIPLVLAYFINMKPPGYKFFRAVIYLPSVVSITIVGIIFGNMFAGDSSGLINSWLGTEIKWLSGQPWAGDTLRWLVILLASIWWQVGTNFVIFSGALRDVPDSLYEACEMDGGSRLHRVLYVTLPNIKSSTAICLFNTLIGYLSLYGQPAVLSELDNASALVSPMMFIQNYLSGGLVYARYTGFISACSIVFGLIVIVLSTVERKVMGGRKRRHKRSDAYHRCAQLAKDFAAASRDGVDGNE